MHRGDGLVWGLCANTFQDIRITIISRFGRSQLPILAFLSLEPTSQGFLVQCSTGRRTAHHVVQGGGAASSEGLGLRVCCFHREVCRRGRNQRLVTGIWGLPSTCATLYLCHLSGCPCRWTLSPRKPHNLDKQTLLSHTGNFLDPDSR